MRASELQTIELVTEYIRKHGVPDGLLELVSEGTEFNEFGYDADGLDRHGYDSHGRFWDSDYRLYL